ncbi:MAG: hypothetical protein ACE5JL_16135, partial [Dehalococcoidia bacterium]
MDCDISMPPTLIPRLVEALDEADLAVGSRFVSGGADQRNSSMAGPSPPGRHEDSRGALCL